MMVEYIEEKTAKITMVAGVYQEVEIPTPSRTGQGMQMVIHSVEFWFTGSKIAAADYVRFYITLKPHAAVEPVQIYDQDVIVFEDLNSPVANPTQTLSYKIVKDFKIPKLIPQGKIYFGCIDVDSEVVECRVNYTMRWVSQRQLYDALTD